MSQGYHLDFHVKRGAIAGYGLSVMDGEDTIMAWSGLTEPSEEESTSGAVAPLKKMAMRTEGKLSANGCS